MRAFKSYLSVKYVIVALTGSLVALLAYKIMALEFRYGLAMVGGIGALCTGLVFIKHIEDYLIYALIFNTSFDMFGKWLFPHPDDIVFANGVSLGLAEVLILIAYFVWFCQIFIIRKEPLPKLHKIDFFIFLLLFSQFISMIGAPKRILSLLDIIYNLKHILIYFFIAQKLKRHHLKWVVIIILVTIFLQSSIASYERLSGNVGIGSSKGSTEKMGDQYEVPGIEERIRAEGTTADSHSLGLYFVMLLPVPLILSSMRFLGIPLKLCTGLILIMGIGGLIVTYTRSGWLFFAVSSAFALFVIFFIWKQKIAVFSFIAITFGISFFYPQGYIDVYDRFKNAPWEVLVERFDMAKTGLNLWQNHFLFGCGSANYMECLEDYDITIYQVSELPVHVLFLYIAAEIGLIGAISYFSIIFISMFRCIKVLKFEDLLIRGLGLAILTAFFGYLLDSMSSPMGRDIVPYYLLWVYIGISVSFQRMMPEKKDNPHNMVMTHR